MAASSEKMRIIVPTRAGGLSPNRLRYHHWMIPNPSDTGAPIGGALRDAKRALREGTPAVRDALDQPRRAAASRAIADRIAALDSFAGARVVLLTLPFRSEWDSRLLVRDALAAGKTVLLPRVDVETRML